MPPCSSRWTCDDLKHHPAKANRSRCVGFRWEEPSYLHLTTHLRSGSTRPEVWKSASESVMQLVPGRQHSERTAGLWGTVAHPCQHERQGNPTPEAKEQTLHGNELELK
uniref:Uncharacterized protein n=1 Tax=Mustela putorius furo TaxID=9669 RepID=M3Y3M1_MUSPF